jgi:hypothetical protein
LFDEICGLLPVAAHEGMAGRYSITCEPRCPPKIEPSLKTAQSAQSTDPTLATDRRRGYRIGWDVLRRNVLFCDGFRTPAHHGPLSLPEIQSG